MCNPKLFSQLKKLADMAVGNRTMNQLLVKLDGTNANEAYLVLKNLDDQELKVLAALVAATNQEFNRGPNNGPTKEAV